MVAVHCLELSVASWQLTVDGGVARDDRVWRGKYWMTGDITKLHTELDI